MNMTERQAKLLTLVVENYIKTGVPVGSTFVVEEGRLDVSGATVRNEMRDLEESGYLTHPHTSAGRIPTEMGYRLYVEELCVSRPITKKDQDDIERSVHDLSEKKEKVKGIAKTVAKQVHNAVIVSFGGKSLYYTGISELFAHPEFKDYAATVEMSAIFDQCEDNIDAVFRAVQVDTPVALIGKQNPLGSACGLVGQRIGNKDLFLVLGPMRMDYQKTIGILQYVSGVCSTY